MGLKVSTLLSSSIFKKQVMAITGLMLCGFLATHLAGNFLLFLGPEIFNTYSHKLITNPFIYVAEAILLSIFLIHIFLALKLTFENSKARPISYYMKKHTGHGATFASSSMLYTGLIVLVFLILHIIKIKFGPVYLITYDGVEMRDLHRLVFEYFKSPLVVVWYVFAVVALGVHVSHGFWSAFQSLGVSLPRYNKLLNTLAKIFAVVITIGYSVLPIYCYLQGQGGY